MSPDLMMVAWGLALVGALGGALVVGGVERVLKWFERR